MNFKALLKNKEFTGAEFPMEPEVEKIFRDALKGRAYGPSDYVFVNPRTGRPWTHCALDRVYKKAATKAGYPKVTLEMFGRHSWVTKKLNEGWTYTKISTWTLNTVAVLEAFYANVTKATRVAIIEMKKRQAS